MNDSFQCPTCNVSHLPPRQASISDTPWTDDCVCSDRVTCVSHQIGGGLPTRPDEDVMRMRAEARHERQVEKWVQMQERFKAAQDQDTLRVLEAERKKAKALENALNRLMRGIEEDRARWRRTGLSLQALRDVLNRYITEEISMGKLVEEVRGMAEAVVHAELAKADDGEISLESPLMLVYSRPEPGNGWRLLEEHETIELQDEWRGSTDICDLWKAEADEPNKRVCDVGETVQFARLRHKNPALVWRRRQPS